MAGKLLPGDIFNALIEIKDLLPPYISSIEVYRALFERSSNLWIAPFVLWDEAEKKLELERDMQMKMESFFKTILYPVINSRLKKLKSMSIDAMTARYGCLHHVLKEVVSGLERIESSISEIMECLVTRQLSIDQTAEAIRERYELEFTTSTEAIRRTSHWCITLIDSIIDQIRKISGELKNGGRLIVLLSADEEMRLRKERRR